MEKYTFLLPAYKARFFEEALLSIKNQTYRDFKVIVSDDCSPEELKPIYDKVCGDDPRFTFRRNEENMGSKSLVSHWNLLVDICDTEWFIMAGDDDVYDPTFLDEMNRLSEKYPNVDLLHARARVIDADGEVTKKDALYYEYVCQLDYLEQLDFYKHVECMGNNILRTIALKDKGGFVNLPLAWGSDMATCNMMSINGVANSGEILFGFRMSGLNISSQSIENKKITRQKFSACCLYDDFMIDLLKRIKFEGTIENKMTYNRVVKQHRQRTAGFLMWQSVSLSFVDYLCYIVKYRRKGYIDSLFVCLKKWVVAQIKSINL